MFLPTEYTMVEFYLKPKILKFGFRAKKKKKTEQYNQLTEWDDQASLAFTLVAKEFTIQTGQPRSLTLVCAQIIETLETWRKDEHEGRSPWQRRGLLYRSKSTEMGLPELLVRSLHYKCRLLRRQVLQLSIFSIWLNMSTRHNTYGCRI
ncbi:PREDICTED: uncharacterized protein LOC104588840 [Nelumbo nucifera]|uniref:Uncharacterized protein LOC104588840 n=1 Tax=Nelumbo nucifera TaxID=4432 RepID=A0A1U7ZBP2_NELNU|nr:PREDICTED: uncharacterized protein LOC104588840 [Nelumbo nucifera]